MARARRSWNMMTGAFAVGDISGGAFNPPLPGDLDDGAGQVGESADLPDGKPGRGAAAAFVFKGLNPEDR